MVTKQLSHLLLRHKMDIPNERYTGDNLRTLEKMKRCAKVKSKDAKKGC